MNASKTQATARSLHCLVACLVSLMVLASGCGRQSVKLISVEPQVLDSFAGSYEADVNTTITIERVEDHLTFAVDRQSSLAVFPVSENIFVHKESGTEITFVKNAAERVTHFLLSRDGQQKQAKRIAQINTNDQTQTVTISQSQVHLLTMGSGQPTVVLWGGSAGWRAVQSGVAKFARTISFDRESADSANGKAEFRTLGEAARELHAALEKSKLAPPYILVGHSFGDALVRVFANEYPKEIAGLVLVDPFQESFLDWLKIHQPKNYDQFATRGRQAYVSDWENSLAELRHASPPSDVPVVLLSAADRRQRSGDALEQGINSSEFAEGTEAVLQAHKEWLAKLPRGKHVEVPGSGHEIPTEQPEVVVQSIKDIVEQIKNSHAKTVAN